jgi:hypothetical protein
LSRDLEKAVEEIPEPEKVLVDKNFLIIKLYGISK